MMVIKQFVFYCVLFYRIGTAVARTNNDSPPMVAKMRKLSFSVEETQSTIQKQVDEANSGSVEGLAMAINYKHSPTLGEQDLMVLARPANAQEDQQLLIDTGSSTLAFCDYSLAQQEQQQQTLYGQCNLYSTPIQCTSATSANFTNANCVRNPNITSFAVTTVDASTAVCAGSNAWWGGIVHQGNIVVGNSTQEDAVTLTTLDNVTYAIMQDPEGFSFCSDSGGKNNEKYADGIFGVAFRGLNPAFLLPSDDDEHQLLDVLCEDTPLGPLATCNYDKYPNTTLDPPLEQILDQSHHDLFGLHLDYEATYSVPENVLIPRLGIFYGGALAVDNIHYHGGTPQTARNAAPKSGQPEKEYFWSYALHSISVGNDSDSHYSFEEDYCANKNQTAKGDKCIADSGNPYIWLPIPEEACKALTKKSDLELQEQFLSIQMQGHDTTEMVTVKIPLFFMLEEWGRGWLRCAGAAGGIALGMPIFQYYYIVYDMANATLTFVDLPRNDTPTLSDFESSATTMIRGYCTMREVVLTTLTMTMMMVLW